MTYHFVHPDPSSTFRSFTFNTYTLICLLLVLTLGCSDTSESLRRLSDRSSPLNTNNGNEDNFYYGDTDTSTHNHEASVDSLEDPIVYVDENFDDILCGQTPYFEDLPRRDLPLPSLSFLDARSALISAFELRHPDSAERIRVGTSGEDNDCVTPFVEGGDLDAWLRASTTVVHECGHVEWFQDWDTREQTFRVSPNHQYRLSNGNDRSRLGMTVSRNSILHDSESRFRPPCQGQIQDTSDCDVYADTYLGGAPSLNGSIESGTQGFAPLFDEANQYSNGLLAAYAIPEAYVGRRVSVRDGVATMMWYLERYLRYARENDNPTYELLSSDSNWRSAILLYWARAEFILEASKGAEELGLFDDLILERVFASVNLEEIQMLRGEAGCFDSIE